MSASKPSPAPDDPPSSLHDTLRARRSRQFMVAQTTLLGIAIAAVTLSNLTGMMETLVFWQSITFCSVVAVVSSIGWVSLSRTDRFTGLVVGLLYVDSVLGLFFFYVAGEFETPALAILSLCVVMAPVFVGKQHAWGIAAAQVGLYGTLLAARQYGWIEPVVPYGYMLPEEAVQEPSYVIDCFSNFAIATFGMAYLAGQASIDILNSQQELESEVTQKTSALRAAEAELRAANADLEQTNAQLERANGDLSRSNSRLEQFNAAVSHDLRSPLQTMVGSAELVALMVHAHPDRAERMADQIIRSANQMALQIDELLKLAQVASRLGELHPVSIATVVSQASQSLQAPMRAARARLELMHPLPHALGNAPLLQELFQNLLENAIKYGGPDGPVVRVEQATARTNRVAIAVEDNGAGIPTDRREHVFGLFKRLDAHREADGVGAGLAIVQRIVEVHGGEIVVEDSAALGGARFVVYLQSIDRNPDLSIPPPDRVH